jgi:DNA-binding response OmpR family regulator
VTPERAHFCNNARVPARRILVIEDDAAIRRGVVDALRFAGYLPLEASTYGDAVHEATRANYDLLLLDLVLPGGDGLGVLAEARKTAPSVPVIIVTARGREADRVRGLELGADDYVVKPFSVRELLARIEAVLRRSAERAGGPRLLHVPAGVVDLRRSEVRAADGGEGGRRVELSERERALLSYLARNPGRVIGRDELLLRVWRLPASASHTRAIDMHVARLREKLGDDAASPRVLLTVRGRGYMLAEDVRLE